MSVLRKYLGKFGVYVTHLPNVVEEPSYQAADPAKVERYIASWSSPSTTMVNLCFFLDVLTPVEFLSVSFQKSFADPVSVVNALTKPFNKLQRLKDRECPTIKFFLDKLEENEDSEVTNQNIQLKDVQGAVESVDGGNSRNCRSPSAHPPGRQ